MQILRLGGENLASVAGAFEIDLVEGPLAQAGLFAITGDTGAGKSTLLDAMCLALYATAPRFESGINDDLLDVDGISTLKACDPRNILRKGCAQGSAWVEFRASDGRHLRAVWSVARARGRAAGKLQAAERSVFDVATGDPLASGKQAVTRFLEEATAMNFAEFRRTHLLAQGDFDAFLRASTPDRAALLEKITGTELYRQISTTVHRETGLVEKDLQALDLRLGEAQPLDEAGRGAILAEIAAGEERAQLAQAEAARARAALDLRANERRAAQDVAEAEACAAAAEAAWQAQEPQRVELADLRALGPYLAPAEGHARALGAVAEAEARLQALDATLAAQTAQCAAAEAHRAEAQTQRLAAERLFRALGPTWSQAEQLDRALAEAVREAEAAAARVVEAEKGAAKAEELYAAHLAAQNADRQRELEAAAARAQLVDLSALARAEASFRSDARAYAKADLDLAVAEGAAEAARAVLASDTRAELADEIARLRADVSAQEARVREMRAHVAESAAAQPAERLSAVLRASHVLGELARLAQEAALEEARCRREGESAAAARARAQTAEAEARAARAQQAPLEAVIAALRAPAEAAEAAVSREAAGLREHLITGDPCPVCGAREHPVMADQALALLAADLRAQVAQARGALAGHQAEAQAKEAAAAQALDLAGAAEARAEDAARARAELGRAWHLGVLDARLGPWAKGLGEVPDLGALSALRADLLALEARLGQENARLISFEAELRRALEAQNETQAALRAAERGLDAANLAQARGRDAAQAAAARLTELRAAQAEIRARFAPFVAGVARVLGGASVSVPSPEAVAKIAVLWRQAEGAWEAVTGQIAARGGVLAKSEAEAGAQAARLLAAREELSAREAVQESRALARAALLGGEATGPHRSRHNTAREAALEVEREAMLQLSRLAAAQSVTEGAQRAASEALAAAAVELARVSALLEPLAQARGLTLAEVSALCASAGGQIAALEETLAAGGAARARAKAVLETQRAAQARWCAEVVGLPDHATLLAARDAQEALLATTQAQLGGWREQLRQDAELRARAQDLLSARANVAARHQVLLAINKAIGSASGDKFSRLAQRVTLRVLVEHANVHLARLKPRYRLVAQGGDLGLHILDADMGDELRASQSLSGGERFLVSLALALALSNLNGGRVAGALFIDEGFGTLDAASLDLAIDALEALQMEGRIVGVISHVAAMKDRIPVQVHLRATGRGRSEVVVRAGAETALLAG